MTLSFSQKWGDKMGDLSGVPNYFTEKIWLSLLSNTEYCNQINDYERRHVEKFGKYFETPEHELRPKPHTIRTDTSNRWKPGMDIHFVINNRTKDRFQFAPVLKCKSVQNIHIKIYRANEYDMNGEHSGIETHREVWIDDVLLGKDATAEIALNDGFPNTKSFFDFFENGFKGKIIHWTDKRY